MQLETKTYSIDPRSLSRLKKNARYMTGQQMKRLTENIKRDGVLTSVPLVHREGEHLVVLSGNHRVEAAIAAGLQEVTVMEVLSDLTPEHRVALQLSHNSLTGQDDPSILFELYDSLSLDEKLFSGLTDDQFKIEELDVTGLSIGNPSYEEISLMFLPAEAEAFKQLVQRIEKRSKKPYTLTAVYGEFDRIFDAIVRVKEKLNIYNTALAFSMMASLAIERLDQLEAQASEQAPN